MEKIHRKNGDLSAAFRQAARQSTQITAEAASTAAPVTSPVPAHAPTRTGKQLVKAILRRMARSLWRVVRPLVRGPLHRLRRFLAEPLLIELRLAQEALRQDVINTQTWAHQEQLRQTVSILQELVATRDKLVRDLAVAMDGATASWAERQARDDAQLGRIETYALKGASRIAVPAGDHPVLVRTAVGYVNCDGRDTALLAELLEAGELEPGTRLLIERILHPGMVFVDVGANIGMHTVAAGRALRGSGKIVAFEPFPRTFGLLRDTLWLNGLDSICELHAAAVSDRAGEKTLFLGKTSGHHSLFPLGDAAGDGEVAVKLVTLDDIVGSAARVDVIKIDVEGAELDVIHGARQLLAANREVVIIVEFGPSHLERTGGSVAQWLAEFAALGFAYRVIDPYTGELGDLPVAALAAAESVNLYMYRSAAGAVV